jgi:hypothetical protein
MKGILIRLDGAGNATTSSVKDSGFTTTVSPPTKTRSLVSVKNSGDVSVEKVEITARKFIEDETMEIGSVEASVYLRYFQAYGGYEFTFAFVSF